MTTERNIMDGLITLIDDRDGSHPEYLDLAEDALAQVKDDWHWDGRNGPGHLTHKAKIIFQADIENPPWAEGKYNGINDGYHMIRIKRVTKDGAPAAGKIKYYTLHELLHAVDTDSLNGDNRKAIMNLMSPKPSGWGDSQGGDAYWHDPSECWADAAVEAFTSPLFESMYDDDYTRNIHDEDYPELYSIMQQGETPGNGDGGAPPEETAPPIPPEYVASVEQAIAFVESAKAHTEAATGDLANALLALHGDLP